MKYVVIETGGKQYKVMPGATIDIQGHGSTKKGEEISFDKVLLHTSDGVVQVGSPYLENVDVKAKVIDHVRGKKVRVARFKAKSRHRRVYGHRDQIARVAIESIEIKSPKADLRKTKKSA